MMSRFLFFAIFLLISYTSFAWTPQAKKKRFISATGYGLHVSSSITGEFNLSHYDNISSLKKRDFEVHGLGLGAEFNFNPRHFILGPKIYYERLFRWYLAGRANFTWFTNFTTHDPRVTPEVFFTVFGLVSVGYGYNIPVTKNEFSAIGRHKGVLMIKIPTGL